MKKLRLLALILILVISMVGCTKEKTEPNEPEKTASTEEVEMVETEKEEPEQPEEVSEAEDIEEETLGQHRTIAEASAVESPIRQETIGFPAHFFARAHNFKPPGRACQPEADSPMRT